MADGRQVVDAQDLSPLAGQAIAEERHVPDLKKPSREAIETALRNERGNVSSTARALGLHRTQLRRMIEKFGIDVKMFSP